MNQHETEHIGGIFEKPLPLENGTDLFNHLYKEMQEEALLNKKDIKDLNLRAVIQSQRGAVNFVFKTTLNITANELKTRFKQNTNHDPDIADLLILNKLEYVDYLENCGRDIKKLMVGLVD